MHTLYQVEILQCDVPNKNGRVYPKEEIEKALVKVREGQQTIWGTVGMPDGGAIPLNDVAFITGNMQLNDKNYLVGDIRVLQTPKGQMLEELLKNPKAGFRTAGIGNVGPDGVVTDFVFTSIALVDDPA
jgi:hypothetical protein